MESNVKDDKTMSKGNILLNSVVWNVVKEEVINNV